MGLRRKYSTRKIISFSIAAVAALIFVFTANLLASPKEHTAIVAFFTDRELLPELVKDLSNAESSINCSLYMFKTDGNDIDSTHLLLNAMLYALDSGVSVKIIFDLGDKDDLTTEFNEYTGRVLTKAGATVLFDSPDRLLHSKMCVIDGKTVYIGSHNYTYSALKRNAETTVRIKSADLAAEALEYLDGLALEHSAPTQK